MPSYSQLFCYTEDMISERIDAENHILTPQSAESTRAPPGVQVKTAVPVPNCSQVLENDFSNNLRDGERRTYKVPGVQAEARPTAARTAAMAEKVEKRMLNEVCLVKTVGWFECERGSSC